MQECLTILVADYVPLSNKGEEAIIRGIEDMLGDGKAVRLAVFGGVDKPKTVGNLTEFPARWIFNIQGRSHTNPPHLLTRIYFRFANYFGLYGNLPRIASGGPNYLKPLQDFFAQADYVLVGHDAVFNTESCAIINLAKQAGKRCGILGYGFSEPIKGAITILKQYRQALARADFCVFRSKTGWEIMRGIAKDPDKCILAPDPAFAMVPYDRQKVLEYLNRHQWYQLARQHSKLVVSCSVCQKDYLLAKCFPRGASTKERMALHCRYLADTFAGVLDRRDIVLVFLPHSIEPGDRNDLSTARRVVEFLGPRAEACAIIEDDLDARMLKGIIRQSDFAIGERRHFLIGTISSETPFIGLLSSDDYSTHDIIGDMGRCEDLLLNMDQFTPEQSAERINDAINRRQQIKADISNTMIELRKQLRLVAGMVKGQ